MSGSDDNASSPPGVRSENDDLTADYRARVQEHRKKRRDSKMTARPPGKATKTLGRPAIFGDTSEIVRPPQPTEQEPNETELSLTALPEDGAGTPDSTVENVIASDDTKANELSVEEEISHHLRALYKARKHGGERGTGSAFAKMQSVDEQAPSRTITGPALKRRSTLTGSLARKLLLPTASTEIPTSNVDNNQQMDATQEAQAPASWKPHVKPPANGATPIFGQPQAPDKVDSGSAVEPVTSLTETTPSSAAFGLSSSPTFAQPNINAASTRIASEESVGAAAEKEQEAPTTTETKSIARSNYEQFLETEPSSAAFGMSSCTSEPRTFETTPEPNTAPESAFEDAELSSGALGFSTVPPVAATETVASDIYAVAAHDEDSSAASPETAAPGPTQIAPQKATVTENWQLQPSREEEAQAPPVVVKKPRYKTDLILAGTETGIKTFTDRYGRRIEAYYSMVLSLPDQLYLVSQDGQFAQGFQLCPGEEYWGARHDDNGKVVARMVLNLNTGTIVGENLLTKSLIRLDPSGDRVEQVRTPAGMKVTIHFADDKTAKKHTGNQNLVVRYCEYTAAGWMIRRDDYLRTGVVESSFFDANMRIPSPERRLRAVTRVIDRQGVKEKSHEEFTYHPERNEAVRIRGSYTDAAGKVTDMHFIPGNNAPVKIKITETSGFTSQLARNPSTHTYEGTCCDRNGTIVEDIVFDGRTLTYRNRGSGKLSRTERFDLLSSGDVKAELQARTTPMIWNAIRGRTEITLPTGMRILKYPTGRTDKIDKDGTVTWEGQVGERSFAAPSGEALVTNPDGSAIRLHRNYSAELKESLNGSFIRGSLSEAQQDFLEKNRNKIDLRDFARFSQQWYQHPEKLEAVLRQLDYLMVARYRDVTLEQVEEIRNCVLHHIAYPEEIFQGHATTSAAAVVQRLFASDLPARYVSIVKESLTGRLTVAGSEVLGLDVANMLRDDMSTRDAASRLFQTLIMRTALHPQYAYDNSWTGIGIDLNSPGQMPAGLTAEITSNVVHKISGVETAIVEIRSVEELRHAYAVNGRRTMIIAVDGNDPPLGCHGSFERQLVTVTGFVGGRNPRIMVANQLGSKLNCCERRSALDARIVFESMMRCAASAGETTGTAIIFGGHHATRYKIEAGKLIPTTSRPETK